MSVTKAEKLLAVIDNLKPGQNIVWPVYDGADITDAKTVENYVTAFFRSGDLMPIPKVKLGLNVRSVQTEHYESNLIDRYSVTIEGLVTKFKEGEVQ